MKVNQPQPYLSHFDEQLTVLPGELTPAEARRQLPGITHRHASRLNLNQAIRALLAESRPAQGK